jgi:cephalosporin-C deacetylase-like acetyl esterase
MPLMFDMPLEELQTYQGTNPVPRDFDGFWDAGLADMRAVDPQVELTPAEFRTSFADCSHMYFTGVGGARIHAKLLRPRNISQTHPAVLICCDLEISRKRTRLCLCFMAIQAVLAIGRACWGMLHRVSA